MDIDQTDNTMHLSQKSYITKNQENSVVPVKININLTESEFQQHRQIARRLAWIATGTSPSSPCADDISLQGLSKPVSLPSVAQNGLRIEKESNLSTIYYILIYYPNTHISLYSDGSYQKLKDEHS